MRTCCQLAIRGDQSLFAREDAVEAAWRVVDGSLKGADPVREYEPGSWGPTEADRVLDPGDHWHDPVVSSPAEPARAPGR